MFEKETIDFPPIITTNIKRSYLEAFHTYIKIEAKWSPYEIYGIFYLTHKLDTLSIEDPRLRGSSYLFSYYSSNPSHTISLYTTYIGDVIKGRVLKYLLGNYVNITRYNKYPEELKDLIFVKEALIIYSYLIRYIIKLSKSI